MNVSPKLNQWAVYWHPKRVWDQGTTVYEEPIEIPVRWTNAHEEFYDKEGTLRVSKSVILAEGAADDGGLPLVVDADGASVVRMVEGGVLWQGRSADLLPDKIDLPFEYSGASEITGRAEIPDKNAEQFLLKYYL